MIKASVQGRTERAISAGIDLVSLPEIGSDLHGKILGSYALDALSNSGEAQQLQPNKLPNFWELLQQSKLSTFNAISLGKDVRFEQPDLIGSILAWEIQTKHLSAYPRNVAVPEDKYQSPRHRHNCINII